MTTEHTFDEGTSRRRLQAAVGEAYEIGRLLGRGGFAEVFEARDPALRRSVAVKTLRPDVATSPTVVERFQREARAIARLRHPNVVEIYTVGERDGVAFYVMPLVRGESLAARLEREGALDPAEAERILMESAAGLGAAHRAGIIHRDVKPANILLDGEERRVLLTDFGIARAAEDEAEPGLTGTRMVVGSPRYLSPEQGAGDAVDHRADLYALGVVAYEMVVGRPPFEAPTARALLVKHLTETPESLRELRPGCPEGLAHAVDRCLAKEPDDRWPDAERLLEALRAGAATGRERIAPRSPGEGAATGPQAGDDVAAVATKDPAVETRSAEEPPRAHRRRILAGAGVAVGAAAVELVAAGTLAFSLPVALVGVAVAVSSVGAARREGVGVAELLTGRSASGGPVAGRADRTGTTGFGAHGEAVRRSRSARGHVLRLYHTLSRVERERFPELPEAVDAVAQAIRLNARRLAALEARMGEVAAPGRATPTGVVVATGEIDDARDRVAAELAEQEAALEQIRHWLVRSGGADSAAVHDQLAAAVARAAAAARRAGA